MLNPDLVPSSVEQAVDNLVAGMTEQDKEDLKTETLSHHFFGRHLRNSWSLWDPDTPLKRDAVLTYGIAHADDISGLIMEWARAKALDEEFDPQRHVQVYHDHWQGLGMTSLSAGGWPPEND